MAKISVIIPSYNCASLVTNAVDSVLAQSLSDFEIIVVDDGSKDNTAATLQPYCRDRRFHYVYQLNKGLPAARNSGARLSQAEYIAFLDADDLLAVDALERMSLALDRSGASWCLVDTMRIRGELREIRHTNLPATDQLHAMLQEDFVRRGMFFRRKDFVAVGLYDEDMRYHEDWDLNIRMFESELPFVYLNAPLYTYIWRQGSLITESEKMLLYTERILRKHHKRLADGGDAQAAKIYACRMWGLSRFYCYRTRNYARAIACACESLWYDFNFSRIFHPMVYHLGPRKARMCSQ